MNPSTNIIAFHGLLKLQNWTDSSRAGRKVSFLIPGEGQNPFKRFTVRDGKIAGQRFTTVLNLVDDVGTPAWNGDMMLLGWNVSGKTGRTITLLIPDDGEDHPFSKYKTGAEGQTFAAAFVELNPDETPVHQPENHVAEDEPDATMQVDESKSKPAKVVEKKPFGGYARDLHRTGWLLNPDVLKTVGCEDDFHAWLLKQPCVFSKSEGHISMGKVGFFKVNGSQEYAAIPVCPCCKAWDIVPLNTRNRYVKQWAEEKISKKLNVESLGFASPEALINYAREHNIVDTLPMVYRRESAVSRQR